ncbi:MAG: sigma-70 family RNA polymerase sigma factor [Clostridia bacterium]|nr:sigma-70 family RNA polymerase sigma factor [Clostridia bacterium]
MERAAVPSMTREQILETWVHTYAGAILKTCFIYLADHDLAQDAMQDTFMKAWKYLERNNPSSIQNEKAWLMRVAINICRDYRRTQWFKHIDFKTSLDELPPSFISMPEEDRDLVIEVGNLPVKYKQLVLLYYYSNMTLQDTAEALGIPKSTAGKRLKRAEEMLKRSLTGGETK